MTAVEWLEQKLIESGLLFKKGEVIEIEQAKEMEKQQLIEMHDKGFDSVQQLNDEFAVEFAEWCLDENHIILNDGKELLEIFKKEKGWI